MAQNWREHVTILYHHRTFGDGAEGIHIAEIIKSFQELGHRVVLVGLPVGTRGAERRSGVLAAVRRWLPEVIIEVAQLATSAMSYPGLRRKIAEVRPEFIYKRHAKYDLGMVLAARRARVPMILEVNGVYAGPSLRQFEPPALPRLLERVERWIFTRVDHAIAVSTPLRKEIERIAPDARTSVMPNGVNHRLFTPDGADPALLRRELNIEAPYVIGFVGTLWKWHGLDLLIEAFERLARPDVHLVIVGDGEMRDELTELCRARRLDNRVTFTGRVAHADVTRWVRLMDVTVLPAEHRVHASPMKLLEYMAVAKPAVAPRLPNIEEIVDDGVDGLLFEPNNVDSMTACLQRLLESKELRIRLGGAARRKIEREFNWLSNGRKVIELYNQQVVARIRA